MSQDFSLGVIEGFYGKSWSFDIRQKQLAFFHKYALSEYIYAPKSDVYLRKQWPAPWPQQSKENLRRLIDHTQQKKLLFSIGLSLLNFDNIKKPFDCLLQKIEQLVALKIDKLYLLFDDMRGDDVNLAKKQINIIEFVRTKFPDLPLGFCPSYYSSDPVLDQVFGLRPKNYLSDLGDALAFDIDIFWTGEKVCSNGYSIAHIEEVNSILKRKVLLWDNYPVNDGRLTSKFLHLKPFTNRPRALKQHLRGHIVNPMNQAYLSRLPLATLADNYYSSANDSQLLFRQAIESCCAELKTLLLRDTERFQTQGLDAIDQLSQEQLLVEYGVYSTSPYATEICDWLAGVYAFDPDCLTS